MAVRQAGLRRALALPMRWLAGSPFPSSTPCPDPAWLAGAQQSSASYAAQVVRDWRRGQASQSAAGAVPPSPRGGRRGQASQSAVAAVPPPEARQVQYKIEVFTGDVRGAGTPSPAAITLYGSEGQSDTFLLGDEGDSTGFEAATHKTFAVWSRELGTLKQVHVQQLTDESESGMGWYLDKIIVAGPGGLRYRFPCAAWLGTPADPKSERAPTERNLMPAVMRSSMSEPTFNLASLHPLHVSASGISLPHPEKVAAGQRAKNKKGLGHGGEDAYFYSSNSNGIYALGVADGVYMWREQGIDAGAFSRRMMEFCRQSIEMGQTDVQGVLNFAQRRLRREGIKGSSTVCLVLVDMLQGQLSAANMGDSGLMQLGRRMLGRSFSAKGATGSAKGTLVVKYRTPQQEHSFGHPYQLGHHKASDQPEDAMLITMPVSPGDILVLGSDGLFDNLSDGEILEAVEADLVQGLKAPAIAQRLAFSAFNNSLDKERDTPFSQAAQEAFDMVYRGGKADDITVLVALLE
eukprot:scaffold14.g1051.t1